MRATSTDTNPLADLHPAEVLRDAGEDLSAWLASVAPLLACLAVLALAVWVWWVGYRARLVRAALADRARVEMVPTSTFDPSDAEVARWARQLGRIHHSAGGVPPRGSAARLRYTAAEDGKMRCLLEGPATAAAVLSMPGFAEVEVRADDAPKNLHPVRFAEGPREPK